jgi:hypothetical protein
MESMSRVSQKHIEELQKSRWGRAILTMVELHALSGGVVQELIDGINDLIADLNEELAELEFDFGVRTNEHNALVVKLEQDIQDAEIDVQRTDDTLENLLKPRRTQLRAKIGGLQENQAHNRKALDEATLIRKQQHEEYEALVAEYNAATGAVDEALALLSTLTNPSLIQVKKFHHSLRKIEARIRPHTQQATLIKALITLAAEQNFSDQGIIGEIVNKLNEFRNQVVQALNDLTATEADNVADFEERVAALDAEYAEFQRGINQANIDLTAVQDKIDELMAFLAQRDADRKCFMAQLDLENTQYAEETEIYTDLKNEYLRELAIAEQALGLVEGVDFSNIKV